MSRLEYAIVDTPAGRCAVAWGERGIVAVQLPERDERTARARLRAHLPTAREAPPPHEVRDAVEGITALLEGAGDDLARIRLDMDGLPEFDRRVYEFLRTVAPGETITYGEVAACIGAPGAARAVGGALARNPFAIVVPCHRVVAAGGRVGGFSATGGTATKLRLLELEGVRLMGARLAAR